MLPRAAGFLMMTVLLANARDRVIVDSDSGIGDDGAALIMLLRSPALVDVAGITLVPGNVWPGQGAADMFRILDALGRSQPPMYSGAEAPLVHTAGMAAEQSRRWGKLQFTGAFADKPQPSTGRQARPGAVEFIISEIESHPGEITVLAIGPMTNLALALRLKPSIESKIKRVVFMGGNVKVPGNVSAAAEFNFWFDPEAARIVLRSRIPQKVMFGLDICNQAPIRKPQFDELTAVRTPITEILRDDMGNRFPGFLKNPSATSSMWDTLAAAYLIDPAFVTRSETMHLDVDATWGRSYGAVIPLNRQFAPEATAVTVALGLDLKRVWSLTRDLLIRKE